MIEVHKISMTSYEFSITESCPYFGRAVIFSFEKFDSNPKASRDGSENDRESLICLFQELGILVSVELNRSKDEVINVVHRISEEEHLDLFICVFLSHGHSNQYFFASDNKSINMNSILETFERSNKLKSCVKIYLSNFCRGEAEDYLYTTEETEKMDHSYPLTNTLKVFSTLPNNRSYRNKKHGTHFISQFVKAVRLCAPNFEVAKILLESNRLLKEKLEQVSGNKGIDKVMVQALHVEQIHFDKSCCLVPQINKDVWKWLDTAIVRDCGNDHLLLKKTKDFSRTMFSSLILNFSCFVDWRQYDTVEKFRRGLGASLGDDVSDYDCAVIIDILHNSVPVQTFFGMRSLIKSMEFGLYTDIFEKQLLCIMSFFFDNISNYSVSNDGTDAINWILLYEDLTNLLQLDIIEGLRAHCPKHVIDLAMFVYEQLNSPYVINIINKCIANTTNYATENIVNSNRTKNAHLHLTYIEVKERFYTLMSEHTGKDKLFAAECIHGNGFVLCEAKHNYCIYIGDVELSESGKHIRDGQGVISSVTEGTVYDGEWKNNKKHGFGYARFPDNSHYFGEWVDDFPEGRGTYGAENGNFCEGVFERNELTGKGKNFVKATGNLYTGEVLRGKYHGVGTVVTSEFTYEGEWNMGVMEGFGQLSLTNGEVFEGLFENGCYVP